MLASECFREIVTLWPNAFRDEDGEFARTWKSVYVGALKPYEGPTLSAAWQKVLRTRTYSTRPMPGDIVKICEEIAPKAPPPAPTFDPKLGLVARDLTEDEKRRYSLMLGEALNNPKVSPAIKEKLRTFGGAWLDKGVSWEEPTETREVARAGR